MRQIVPFVALLLVLASCASPSAPAASPSSTSSAPAAVGSAADAPSTSVVPAASGAAGTAVEQTPVWLSQTAFAVLWRPASAADRKPVAVMLMHEYADVTHH